MSAVGRDAERSALEQFISAVGGPRVMLIQGPPGIGKTTLWEAGTAIARDRGLMVLSTAAAESETHLSFAGLCDLLDGVDLTALDGLSGPQRYALEVALRRAEPAASAPEMLTICGGFLGALRQLSLSGRVIVAVDDVQWLDPSTADVLDFAARRLRHDDVRILAAARIEGGDSTLQRSLEPGAVEHLELAALRFGAINRLLADRFGMSLPRRLARRVFEVSGGNPLFALELGRALKQRGIPELGEDVPLPSVVEELFGAQVAELPEPLSEALRSVALSGSLTLPECRALLGEEPLEEAMAAGLLTVQQSRVRPRHPILGAVAIQQCSPRRVRELHQRLASVVADESLRLRHLALATDELDPELAERLADAVFSARARGSVHEATELASHALRMTPADTLEHADRLLALADCLQAGGEDDRVLELLEAKADELPTARARATAHLLLGHASPLLAEERHLERAIAEGGEDREIRVRALAAKAELLAVARVERIAEAEQIATEAVALAAATTPELELRARVSLAWARIARGLPVEDLASRSGGARSAGPLYAFAIERPAAVRLAFRGEVHQARAAFAELLELAEQRGEAASISTFELQLCEVDLRAGRLQSAADVASNWHLGAEYYEEAKGARTRLAALLAALKGEPEVACGAAAEVLEISTRDPGVGWDRLEALRADGIAALLAGNPTRAVERLTTVWEHCEREGVNDPGAFPVAADLVEALLSAGAPDAAAAVTHRLRRLSSEQDHPWGLITTSRCAAALALGERHEGSEADAMRTAARSFEELGLHVDAARTLLQLGQLLRRHRKRTDARGVLDQAAATFEQMGADGWAERARAERARVSGRAPAGPGELTPSEQRVAALAAEGLSNKEIAAQLVVTVFTVEAHLSSAYAKLGVRSRTQLARRLVDTR
jgi:DNA-binding CsgD family transcriptional regulator